MTFTAVSTLPGIISMHFLCTCLFQSTPEYVRSVPSIRTVDSYQIDSEWKKGVEASMLSLKDGQENTLRVLRQLLSKLDPSTSMQATPITTVNNQEAEVPPAVPAPDETVLTSSASPKRSVGVTTTATQSSPISTVENQGAQSKQRTDAPNNMASDDGMYLDICIVHGDPNDITDLGTADGETEVPLDIQRLRAGLDPNFQAPVPTKRRATHGSVELTTSFPKTRSKKGNATSQLPPISPSSPGRLQPRDTTDPVAVGKPCWILHPLHGHVAIAYGKSGPNWKAKGQCLATLQSGGADGISAWNIHGVGATHVP
jgi:hypothetical protein